MWKTKYFNTEKEANEWMLFNNDKYICHLVFVHNAYAVEYKPLKKIDIN